MQPLISIGLPVYNGGPFLRETLDSLLAQTVGDFDLIISDNASTDETADTCAEYARLDSRIRYHRNPTNLGLAGNFNRAFQLSTGKYFKWAGHDDICAPTFLEKCLEVLERDSSSVLCLPWTAFIDADGREIRNEDLIDNKYYVDANKNVLFMEVYTPPRKLSSALVHERLWELVLDTPWGNELCGLVRSDALRKTSLLGSYPSSDKVLLSELILMGRFADVPEVLFYNRCHAKQSSHLKASQKQLNWATQRVRLPVLDRLQGIARAIANADMSNADRLACCRVFVPYLLGPKRWKRLLSGDRTRKLQKIRAQLANVTGTTLEQA